MKMWPHSATHPHKEFPPIPKAYVSISCLVSFPFSGELARKYIYIYIYIYIYFFSFMYVIKYKAK